MIKMYIVKDRGMWPEEFDMYVNDIILERTTEAEDVKMTMERLVDWLIDYTTKICCDDIIYHRFEIEPEKGAQLQQLWAYAKRRCVDARFMNVENYGGSNGSKTSSTAVVTIFADYIVEFRNVLSLALKDLMAEYKDFCSRERVISDIAPKVVTVSTRPSLRPDFQLRKIRIIDEEHPYTEV